jgi:hypothetical protein
VLQMLKQRVSRKLRKTKTKTANRLQRVRLLFPELAESFPQFWQVRFYDFNVYSDRKRREKLDYMHRNPVTRKLVQRPQDWPWSSYLSYERGEAGLIPSIPFSSAPRNPKSPASQPEAGHPADSLSRPCPPWHPEHGVPAKSRRVESDRSAVIASKS